MTLIRPYERRDYSNIIEISKYIWDGRDYLPRLINEFKQDVHCKPFVLEEEGKVVSVVNMNYYTTEFIWFEAMRTHPDYRNKGLATKLNEYLFQEGKNSGAKEIWLSTSQSNEATGKMLLNSGFQEIELLKYWNNSDEFDDKDLDSYNGLIDGSLKNIAYLELNISDIIIELEKKWRPAKDIEEIKAIARNKLEPGKKPFTFFIGEFCIFPIESYFVESWIREKYFYINDQTNSIMVFKPAKEHESSYIIGIYDFEPDVIISALYYGFNQVSSNDNIDKSQLSKVDIKLFYPKAVNCELLDTTKIFRIMKKDVL